MPVILSRLLNSTADRASAQCPVVSQKPIRNRTGVDMMLQMNNTPAQAYVQALIYQSSSISKHILSPSREAAGAGTSTGMAAAVHSLSTATTLPGAFTVVDKKSTVWCSHC